MSVVFINHPLETWTPTSSGALATIIWQCCRLEQGQPNPPYVITRGSQEARFPWARTFTIDPPALPTHPLAVKVLRAERKLTGWRHLRHRAYAFQVAATIAKHKLDTLPFVLINDPEMAVYLRRRFPQARILHWFQNQLESAPRFRALYAQAVDVTAGVSDFTGRWVSDYYGVPAVQTIYNGLDGEQFTPRADGPDETPILNFVGRTGIEKAPDLLLRAALRLADTTRDFGVQMIGSNHWDRFELDDYQRSLLGLVAQLEARGISVARPGHIGRAMLPAAIRQAHIHVVPSRWDEPFGLTTVEGMASGLAVVASRTGGTPEVVGEAGLMFERDNADDLANNLAQLIADPDLRVRYAHLARERALEFPWERTWQRLRFLLAV